MPNPLMTPAQRAALQGATWALVENFRTKNDLSPLAIFEFLVGFAWGYARRQGESNEVITAQMRAHCERCERDYQHALREQFKLPGVS